MSKSKIEWTQETWNPITGCTKHSEGCKNCYAEKMTKRLAAMKQEKYKNGFDMISLHNTTKYFGEKPKMIFVNSMSDLFHKDVPDRFICDVITNIQFQPQHIFQILTKRSERLKHFNPHKYSKQSFEGSFPNNAWVGVSVELAKYKDRIDDLQKTNASVKFLSCEPLLGDLGELDLTGIDWVIVGGESGPGARPMHPDWVLNIQKQCIEQNVPFFFKQWGDWIACMHITDDINCSFNKAHKILLNNGVLIDGIFPKDVKEFEKNNYSIDGLHGVIISKVGKYKAGCSLYGTEYKQWPKEVQQ